MPAAKASLYSVHPGIGMVQKWKNELPQKTGRSLEEWIALVKKSGPPTEKERRDRESKGWLKKAYEMDKISDMTTPM